MKLQTKCSIVNGFIKSQPNSSLLYMEVRSRICRDSIHRNSMGYLELRKVCIIQILFRLRLCDNEKRIQYCKDLIKENTADPNYSKLRKEERGDLIGVRLVSICSVWI